MIGIDDASRIEGATAYDSSGDKVGKIGRLYLDDETGQPSWITVSTGFFGSSESFVPLEGASFDGDGVRLAFDKDKVKSAPRMDTDQHLEHSEEQELYRYYGLGDGTLGDSAGTTGGYETAGTTGTTGTYETARTTGTYDTADTADTARTTDSEAAVTLNEERLEVGKESHEAGRARLRKYTTTETETVDVPVTKERLVVDRQPATGQATSGSIAEGEQVEEITLREERAVVDKETVAVEEVRVGKEQVTENQQVSEEVRREHADLDVDGTAETTAQGTSGTRGTSGI